MINTQTTIDKTNATINYAANGRFARARDTIAAATKTAKTTANAKTTITTNPHIQNATAQNPISTLH
eukprot:11919857-Ditylum_brightwellii.AAC.1